jgi:hypothetical protein
MANVETPEENNMDITAPKLGDFIKLDDRDFGTNLIASDWDAADFRLPGSLQALAVTVEITGRKVRHDSPLNEAAVRVRVTFVHDGEPDTTASGWMISR